MRTFLLICLLPLSLFARKVLEYPTVHPDLGLPWLTGPLISPSSLTIPPGHYNIEPFLSTVANTGVYQENWSVQKNEHVFLANSLLFSYQLGLLSWLDFQANPIVYYNYTDGVGSWAFGDLLVGFDIQLYRAHVEDWIPNVKLIVKETFPTGKYQKLAPKKKGTDAGGNGSYITGVGIVFGKLSHFGGERFLSSRLTFQYSFPTPVPVKGFNTYGGTETTDGTFYPAQNAQAILGLEYTWTRHWALAIDAVFNWANGTDFSGDAITDQQLSLSPIGENPLIQYSLAPAIEYNWSPQLGLIAGSWFTIAGKNAVQFFSGVIAINYYH